MRAIIKLTIELADSLRRSMEALAQKEGYSVEQFLANAAAEKMAAVRALEYLRREAASGRREDFERLLAAVADNERTGTDRIRK